MAIKWSDKRRDHLQRMLDTGMTPKQCATEMCVKPETIKHAIERLGLRYTPLRTFTQSRSCEVKRLPVFDGWSFDAEEPGDGVGPRYSPRSMAESMPRRGGD